MDKKQVYHIVEWVIALAACGFLVWKLATYDDYATLWATLRAMGPMQWGALALCVALMPVNMAIEAWKWRTLIIHNSQCTMHSSKFTIHNSQCTMHNLSFAEAQRQVYYSKLAGLITPWRLGEYPARAVLMARASIHNSQFTILSPKGHDYLTKSNFHNSQLRIKNAQATSSEREIWARVLSMGAVGSATMTAAIVIAGGMALLAQVLFQESMDAFVILYRYCNIFILVAVLLALALYFAPRLLKRWAEVSHRLVIVTLGQSFVRLVCWCVQLILVLYALGAISPQPSAFSLSFIYYLLVTVTPNVPVAEVGVRGAWAIVLFGTPAAALAGVLLWAINTLLPCLVWPFIRKKT